ncbi:quinone oxidoreductase family protein [Corynebacterium glyciniphilum]|uniref:quinone oxidoreductase family protein n=1 Tax=Corynebacterium glyciniphilum TaxID=1404244 RepID=UPI003DA05D43
MSQTMTALTATADRRWALAEVPRPVPGDGEVLVRARAVATNEVDRLQLADTTNAGDIAGFEFAGDVAELGGRVDTWELGDTVMGTAPRAFAEYVVVDHRHIISSPEGMEPAAACALPVGLSTEHGALTKAGFSAGDSVLVTGASTGIGLLGVQVVKALGALRVLGTTRSPEKRELLSSVGVDTVIVTTEEPISEVVLAATEGEGVNVVLDHVAGQTFAECLPLTRHDGRVVNIGRLDGAAATIDIDDLSYRNLTVFGVSFGASRPVELGRNLSDLEHEVIPAVVRGHISPVVDQVLPWIRHDDAAAQLMSGDAHGKIVLTLDQD